MKGFAARFTDTVAQLTFCDKMLPSQPHYRSEFQGGDERFYPALYGALMRYSGLKHPAEEFRLQGSDQMKTELLASSPTLLRFLQMLIWLHRPRRILEIGAFIGISAMQMARALPETGRVVTIEKYEHFATLAEQNFRLNGLQHKIRLIRGDAFEEIPRLGSSESFEMIFLDGNKERYADYFPLLDARLAPQGLLVADDILFHCDVLNEPPRTEKGAGVKKFLELVEARDEYRKVILPISDGTMLMFKTGGVVERASPGLP